MARIKITGYFTPDIVDSLKRVAAISDRSISELVEDAVVRRFTDNGREAEQAALIAKLDQLARRLGAIEKGQETHLELTAQTARFTLGLAPEVPEGDRVTLNARGADRFRAIMTGIVTRLSSGRSTWREVLAAHQPSTPAPVQTLEAAE